VPDPKELEFQTLLATAHALADKAGAVILPHFRTDGAVDHKGGDLFDPVTKADRDAETAIRAGLAQAYPSHGILGEEFGATATDAEYCWIIDPIDGTRAFIAGQPLWGTLIGLEHEGTPVLGVLDQPYLRERFTGAGGRTELRHAGAVSALITRTCAKLADAVICTTHPMLHFGDEERELYWRVEKACRLSRYGGDCYAYALVAMGFVDLVIETDLKRWDIAAIIPIVEGAGGIVTDWNGKPILDGGNIVAAGDARVHAEALKILRG
jgi:myo-inositol-1(or 4)-monophosphatase